MKPPVCGVCGKRFSPGKGLGGGDAVRFADYEPLPELMVGHPTGMVWICGEHLEMARSHARLTTKDAIKTIRASL